MAGQNAPNARPREHLGRLCSGTMRGIDSIRVVPHLLISGFGVRNPKKTGPPEAEIHRRIRLGTLNGNRYFHRASRELMPSLSGDLFAAIVVSRLRDGLATLMNLTGKQRFCEVIL
jgi:hypothetical protein